MSLLTFTHTAGSFTPARNPERPLHTPEFVQASGVTAGGVRVGYAPVISQDRITLHWSWLASGDVAALTSFFRVAAQGMINDFTLYDPWSATSYAVAFAEPLITGTDRSYGGQEVTLTLRRVLP